MQVKEDLNAKFNWKCQPQAEQIIIKAINRAINTNSATAQLDEDLNKVASTKLLDWIDHIVIENTLEMTKELELAGFIPDIEKNTYFHPGAQLPKVVLKKTANETEGLAVSVDHIADFIMAHGGGEYLIEGSQFGNYRKCWFKTEGGSTLWIVERRGTRTMSPTHESIEVINTYNQAIEKWQMRPRTLDREEEDLQQAIILAKALVKEIGRDRAAWTVLCVERAYWQFRNKAGQIQKFRQDRLGMGWANHDHHTFRSSRQLFKLLVELFEVLGFEGRERYYTGKEAGWGAQIMENPNCRLILFLDVDLGPDEILIDFSHEPLKGLSKLGTIGLWCALHGDSIGHAGMHHLEAQFRFDQLTDDLEQEGVKLMKPFSDFPYLKQAFTQGEIWRVEARRLLTLLKEGKITEEQAEKFSTEGAVGSHLENLERHEGYKGFNQKNVSMIIKETDPRLVK